MFPLRKNKNNILVYFGSAVILLTLVAFITPKIMSRPGGPPPSCGLKTSRDIRTVGQALEHYKLQNFSYPSTEQGLAALMAEPWLKSLPRDEWQVPFIYKNDDGVVEVISLGKDGRVGGVGCNKDLERAAMFEPLATW